MCAIQVDGRLNENSELSPLPVGTVVRKVEGEENGSVKDVQGCRIDVMVVM